MGSWPRFATRLRRHAALRGAITTEVNEEIDQAVGLYAHIGFGAIGRSERDGQGRPWPLIPLRFDPQS